MHPRPTPDTLGYGKDVATLPWQCAACHPCHSASIELCTRLAFSLKSKRRPSVSVPKRMAGEEAALCTRLAFLRLRPNRRPPASAPKRLAGEEAMPQLASQTFCRHIRVWKGCANTLMALCCLPSMSFSSCGTLHQIGTLAQVQPEALSFSAKADGW